MPTDDRIGMARIIPHLCGMPSHVREKRLIMGLSAFFDESGTDPKGPAFVMGGFVSSVVEWEKASDAWHTSLHESPAVNSFHHSEAQSLTGEFKGWKREDADAKVLALAKTIARFDLQGFITTISHSWFAPRDKRAAGGMFGSRIYDHAFLKVVSGVVSYVKFRVPGDDKVDFTFHRRGELKQCIPVYEELRDHLQPDFMCRAGSCVPGDDSIVALQMADLLAWETLKTVERLANSEAFLSIHRAHPLLYLPCTPPKWLPYSLAIHSFGQSVKDVSDILLKRIYGDKEKTPELAADVYTLMTEKAEFDQHFLAFCELTGSVTEYQEYLLQCAELWAGIRKRLEKD